jgi:hypothetical protein
MHFYGLDKFYYLCKSLEYIENNFVFLLFKIYLFGRHLIYTELIRNIANI